jgi:hypothetical protein
MNSVFRFSSGPTSFDRFAISARSGSSRQHERSARTRWLPFELHPEPGGAPNPSITPNGPRSNVVYGCLRAESASRSSPRGGTSIRASRWRRASWYARRGDDASAPFHRAVARALFVDGADIADPHVVARYAADEGVPENDVRTAWATHAYAAAVDDAIHAARAAGVRGVPAYGWPGSPAITGMVEPERIVDALRTLKAPS